MNKEKQQAEKYWAYQAKMENRQRMIDKGWGDRKSYNKLLAEVEKRERIFKYKKIASDVFVTLIFIVFMFFLLFYVGSFEQFGG